ncbi:hypothetical protein ENBRE01_1243 [Enteropsectra breve]|nr:hypothetical protein ENBRE01_1243 [Enteropsectra breve]
MIFSSDNTDSTIKRRSKRSKTIAFDPKNMEKPVAQSKNTQHIDTSAKNARTFNFSDLIDAFHQIEKRAADSSPAKVLKKFKYDDHNTEYTNYYKLNNEIFPKIQNNPFLKNNKTIPMSIIDSASNNKKAMPQHRKHETGTDGAHF